MGNLSSLYGLGQGLNTNIATQAALPYQLNLPNYGAMTSQSSSNILSLLHGQVPQDVANQISQMAAERGVSTGSIGSPNSNAALLQSLGLTSLGLQSQGEQELSGAVGRTPTGQQFNLSSFLNSPDTYQQAQTAANTMAAAPNPTAAYQAQIETALFGNQLGRSMGPQASPISSILSGSPITTPGEINPGGALSLATPNPTTPGTLGTGIPGDFMGDFTNPDLSGFSPYDTGGDPWQTGMPLDNYSGDVFGGDLFGG